MGELPLHANSSTPRRAFSGPVGSSNYSHLQGLLLLFRHAVVSNSVQPHGLRHARHPRPSEECIFNIISFCLFTLTVHGVLRQECWSGLLFPSSVDHLQGRCQKNRNCVYKPRGPFLSLSLLSWSHYTVGKTPREWCTPVPHFTPIIWGSLSSWTHTTILWRNSLGGFPDGPVVKTPRFHCGGCGFDPWSEN